MPSSYSPLLRLTLPADGELVGTWGQTVNNGITSLEESAIAGTAIVAMADADKVLTVANGAADQARSAVINCTGVLTAQRNVVCPSSSKTYLVRNSTTGGFGVQIKTAAGTGVVVPAGGAMFVYCDGVNVVPALDTFAGPLAIPLGTEAAPGLFFAGDANTGLYSPAADQIAFSIGNSTRFRINDSLATAATAGALTLGVVTTGRLTTASSPPLFALSTILDATQVEISAGSSSNSVSGITFAGSTASSSPGTVRLFTASQERMRLDAGGNLGIGQSPSNGYGKLQVASTVTAIPTIDSIFPAGNMYGYFGTRGVAAPEWIVLAGPYNNALHKAGILFQDTYYDNNQYSGRYIQADNQSLVFGRLLNGVVGTSNGTLNEQMRLDVNGNIGIGGQSPGVRIYAVATGSGARCRLQSSDASGVVFETNADASNSGWVGTVSNHPLVFAVNSAERARIATNGQLLVGGTSGSSGRQVEIISNNLAGIAFRSLTQPAKWFSVENNGSALTVYNNANVGVYLPDGATAWVANSDERLKADFAPFVGALDSVLSLRAGLGRYKKDAEDVRRSFLFAQDVQAVQPSFVSPVPDGSGMLGLSYTDMIPLLVAAIKDMHANMTAQIQDLRMRLAAAGF